jgi:S-adenosylmethionine synthetase
MIFHIGAADRFPDSCNSNPNAAHRLNAAATAHLATATHSRGIFLIYISTDYVFPGRPGEAPYKSTSPTDPPNVYGKTKEEGEQGILAVAGDKEQTLKEQRRVPGVVLRVPLLYGPVPEGDRSVSVVNGIVSDIWKSQSNTAAEAAAKPKIKVDDWAQRFPTCTEDVARICKEIASVYLGEDARGKQLPRILQFSAEEQFTKWSMCQLLAEILGLPIDGMEPDKPAEGASVQRPYDCHLDTSDLKDLGIDTSTIKFETWWRRELRAFRH